MSPLLQMQPMETAPKDGEMFLAFYESDQGPKFGPMQWSIWIKDQTKRYFQSWATLAESNKAIGWCLVKIEPINPQG